MLCSLLSGNTLIQVVFLSSFLKVRKKKPVPVGSQGTAVLVQAGPEHCTQGTEPYALFEIRGLYSSSVQDDPKAVFRS